MKKLIFVLITAIFVSCTSRAQQADNKQSNEQAKQKKEKMDTKKYAVEKTDAEWKELLTAEEYHILREQGTEYPNTGKYNLHFDNGIYKCKGCGTQLFESNNKFESHCGWPSFDDAIEGTVEYIQDTSHGMVRTEIRCAKCGGHLGHVFNDGPTETGKRYCVNSASIDFEKE